MSRARSAVTMPWWTGQGCGRRHRRPRRRRLRSIRDDRRRGASSSGAHVARDLMSEAIRTHQMSSEAIRGHQSGAHVARDLSTISFPETRERPRGRVATPSPRRCGARAAPCLRTCSRRCNRLGRGASRRACSRRHGSPDDGGTQTHSDALRRTQTHADARRRTQTHAGARRRTQTPSKAI